VVFVDPAIDISFPRAFFAFSVAGDFVGTNGSPSQEWWPSFVRANSNLGATKWTLQKRLELAKTIAIYATNAIRMVVCTMCKEGVFLLH